MRRLIPKFILQKVKQKQYSGNLNGFILHIDIKGFTELTNDLMVSSESGAEIITDIINAVFTPAIDAIETRGGFITGFAGDAFTSIFEETNLPGIVNAAMFIREYFRNSGIIETEHGDFNLFVKIGISKGNFSWKILPLNERLFYWFYGKGILDSIAAEEMALHNQIIVHNSAIENLTENNITIENFQEDFFILREANFKNKRDILKPDNSLKTARKSKQISNIPSEGEYREVITCFIKFFDINQEQVKTICLLCEKHGGYFHKIDCTEKGLIGLVTFGAPVAYEKRIERSLKFSTDLISLYTNKIKIGLTYGKVFAGYIGSKLRSEYTVLGKNVNLAARFIFNSEWGEIWFDEFILKESNLKLNYNYLGNLEFKGYQNSIATYRLLGIIKEVTSLSNHKRLIGRKHLIKRLLKNCEELKENRFAGITYIAGEAGQGKTRLLYELMAELGDKVNFYILSTDYLYKNSLHPFISWINSIFISLSPSSLTERRDNFEYNWSRFIDTIINHNNINELIEQLRVVKSTIAGVIGLGNEDSAYLKLEPELKLPAIALAVKTILQALCQIKPVVIAIEDINWLADESKYILQVITRNSSALPFKLILTLKPSDNGSYSFIKFDETVNISKIILKGLSNNQTKAFVKHILSGEPSESLLSYIISLSSGNPFVIEQLCLYLLENGLLSESEHYFTLKEKEGNLPKEMQSFIVARLDRLEKKLKKTVQTASVIGREFAVKILTKTLQQLEGEQQEFNSMSVVKNLKAGEEEHIWNVLNETSYIFSHNLLRDTAYEMQLKKNLKKIHLLTAETLEQLYPEDPTKYGETAEHFLRSGSLLKAEKLFKKAGEHGLKFYNTFDSIKYYQKSLEINEKLFGKTHSKTALSLNNIASSYHLRGDVDKAIDYYKKAHTIHQKTLNKQDPEFTENLLSMGKALLDKDEHNKALECFEKGLKIREESQQKNHPETAQFLNCIGLVFYRLNKFQSAMEYHNKALSLRRTIYKDDHQDIADSLCNIGTIYSSLGEFDKALDYLEGSLNIQKKVLGEKHPKIGDTFLNIGSIFFSKNKYKEALLFYDKSLSITIEFLGNKHPKNALIFNNISNVYRKMNNYDSSLKYLEDALKILMEVYGEVHSQTSTIISNMADIHFIKANYMKSLELYKKTLANNIKIFGDNSLLVAKNLNNIGNIYVKTGDFKEAIKNYQKSLKIEKNILGNKNPAIAKRLNNLGVVYLKLKDFSKANSFFQNSLKINLAIWGENHLETAMNYSNIAQVLYNRKNHDECLKYLFKCLEIRKKIYGEKSQEIASTINFIGLVHKSKGDFDSALSYLDKAMSMWKSILGEKHPNIGISLNNIGIINNVMGNHEIALDLFKRAYSIFEKFFNKKHLVFKEVYKNLSETYEKMGNMEKAEEYKLLLKSF